MSKYLSLHWLSRKLGGGRLLRESPQCGAGLSSTPDFLVQQSLRFAAWRVPATKDRRQGRRLQVVDKRLVILIFLQLHWTFAL
ncbi:unnamed protein product [Protopolystoma xenopodis]|uniref:Uncharacterized protein n=1 Tax=Protopolystoma xenopodis TaxID=117903 RepID=A0A3S5BNH4_9PLAT|nr:unnamed protein product [Protopolystoma xenopodis]